MRQILKNMIRTSFPVFVEEQQLYGSSIQAAKNKFCLIFRHDMDDISTQDRLDLFLAQDKENKAPSVLFFLEEDFDLVSRNAQSLKENGYEIQLHSEAKPNSALHLPKIPSEAWVTWRYAGNLKRQQNKFDRVINANIVRGHCAHASNNYLFYKNAANWNVIERASCNAGYHYLSDWRIPARTAEGHAFEDYAAPYWHIRADGRKTLILPTLWDDKYFFKSFEQTCLPGQSKDLAPETALENALQILEICRAKDTPFIVNLHPVHMIKPQNPIADFKAELCRQAHVQGWPVMTMQDYYSNANDR